MSYIEDNDNVEVDLSFNHINYQVYQLLEDLEVAGDNSSPRGLQTKSANLATLEIDPLYSVMNFEPREFNFRYFAGELAWYLRADTNIDYINNFSSFWKNICPNGHANSNYGSLLLKVHPSQTVADFDGSMIPNKQYGNQLEWVYNSLAKDQNSRQAVAFFNAPYFQYEGNRDFVCTMYMNFFINKGYLDMKVQMRSNDVYFGLTYDAPWFSTIQQSMYLNLKKIYPELKLGMYYHCADNIHYYERHFDLTKEILDSTLGNSIKLELKEPLFIFNKGKLVLSEAAKTYLDSVDKIVDSGDISKDQIFWKTTLESLYEITGDHAQN
jgi:thymidylate synthase